MSNRPSALTDAEWRDFQAIPDQGHSHRAWINARIEEAQQEVDALVAERDAYRRAKQENDERFILLRNEARAERDAAWQAVDALARWKAEALPVLDGLQEIGHALGLPLGEQITGPAALEAINALKAERDAAREAPDVNERDALVADLRALSEVLTCEWTNGATCEETCCINGQIQHLIAKHETKPEVSEPDGPGPVDTATDICVCGHHIGIHGHFSGCLSEVGLEYCPCKKNSEDFS